jgi:hypothetical protein
VEQTSKSIQARIVKSDRPDYRDFNKMNRLSRLGVILSAAYLLFVVFCIVNAEYCFQNDGLFGATSYFLPGLPWSLVLAVMPERLAAWSQPRFGDLLSGLY